jgi:hypothetical protein
LAALVHPLKPMVEGIRAAILLADLAVMEGIKRPSHVERN